MGRPVRRARPREEHADQHRQRERGTARPQGRSVRHHARPVPTRLLHEVDGRPHRRPERRLEGPRHLDDRQHSRALAHGDRQGHDEQGGAVSGEAEPAGGLGAQGAPFDRSAMPTNPFALVAILAVLAQAEHVDLAGLATVDLPPAFTPVGLGQDGPREGRFDPATLDRHHNDYQITFRFEQAPRTLAGRQLAFPALLHVTLFNPDRQKPDPTKITFTTISRFYPPVRNDRPRLDEIFRNLTRGDI